ncbi:hypothetical protein K2173_016063 [Erythroxylum novogranatense]|uniref:Uncharacterized protein n=1 Tax=Erythroxylum novogranatense TaxID=1862640 RepID=A0AAV8SF80_9ROSI|nr:hypothetical protein K2173_016063 [Erythroxylum novogranatense]
MARNKCTRREVTRIWTAEEDQKLAEVINIHGPRRWKTVAAIAGLGRCGKSCRLRWMNYLRPNIKRGNISDQEEDLILRLHKLLGNRWSLIAGRLPGRTDNEIKNYWNSHLSKKIKQNEERITPSTSKMSGTDKDKMPEMEKPAKGIDEGTSVTKNDPEFSSVGDDQLYDLPGEGPLNLEQVSKFFDWDETWFEFVRTHN